MTIAPIRALALLVGLAVALVACAPTGVQSPGGAAPSSVAVSPRFGNCPTAQPAPLAAGASRTVSIKTDLGEILIHIEGDLSPIAAGNFVALAECGFYDGVVFHRVLPGYLIQGGDGVNGRSPNVDPARVGSGGPGYMIQDEPVTALYRRGIVAMARQPVPNSAGSQFFIVLDDSARSNLEPANTYQIIGAVASGMETADAIAAAADAEIPSRPVVMTDVSVSGS